MVMVVAVAVAVNEVIVIDSSIDQQKSINKDFT